MSGFPLPPAALAALEQLQREGFRSGVERRQRDKPVAVERREGPRRRSDVIGVDSTRSAR